MKYIETRIDHMASCHDDARLTNAPDNENNSCLTIGDDVFMPFIGWMKYDAATEGWTEISQEEEERIVTKLSESCSLRELTVREAGEKFSDDIEFIE